MSFIGVTGDKKRLSRARNSWIFLIGPSVYARGFSGATGDGARQPATTVGFADGDGDDRRNRA
ncbi:hypothetical protein DN532_30875, partial [Burkholderia multivorans]